MYLQKKYDIRMHCGITKWLRQFKLEDIHYQTRYLYLSTPAIVPAKKIPDSVLPPPDQSLEKRVKELEGLLEDEQLRSEAYLRIIDFAEKEYNLPIRKKPDTM